MVDICCLQVKRIIRRILTNENQKRTMELFYKDCKVKEIENMSMIDTVRSQMMEAMKNKDKTRKDALSMLLSALKNKAIDKRADLTEAEELKW